MDDPVPPSRSQPKTPKDIETICLKCLEKDPRKRYSTAEELAADLQRFLAQEPFKARPNSHTERVCRWCRRNPRIAIPSGLALALLACLITGGAAAVFIINEARIEATNAAVAEMEAKKNAEEATDLESRAADLAVDSLMVIVKQVQKELLRVPNSRETQRKLVETAILTLDEISKQEYKSSFRVHLLARDRGNYRPLWT